MPVLKGFQRRLIAIVISLLFTSIVTISGLTQANGQSGVQRPGKVDESQSVVLRSPKIETATHHDVSLPLRQLPPAAREPGKREHPIELLPRPFNPGAVDPVVQRSVGTAQIPTTTTNFEGVGQGFTGPAGTFTVGGAPPDTNGDVGPNHYVQIVNTDFAIFNKSGTPIFGPVPINTLWSGFGGGCQLTNNGDPVAIYDPLADRWIISQFSLSSTPYLECVAVSTSPDPTGSYNRYSFSYSNFPDYPKMSVWLDAYYTTFNMFNASGTSFLGAKACAYDRAKMLLGQAATQQCFDLSTSFGSLLASDVDGAPPPAGSPNYMLALGANINQLAFWKFHVDWNTPANSTLIGPTTLTTASYSEACSGGGTCIPQAGTAQMLDSLGERLMFRLAYRNFGDHESLVVNHSVAAGSSVGVRWYELRLSGSTPSIYQQGTYAPDSNYRWMGSIAMDRNGNIALGFSLSGSSIHPEIHYTGRLTGDTLGQMTQGEGTIIDGAGSQTGSRGLTRWGDYSMMSVDPTDDCTFWYTNEYIPSNGEFNWRTRIGSFRLPGCGAPTNDFSISANPTSLSLVQGASGTSTISTALTTGSAQSVSLTVSGVPSGATATLSPTSVTAGGSSTLTVNAGTAPGMGTYPLTVTGTGTTATHSTPVTLMVTSSGGNGLTNGGFETGNLTSWTSLGTTAVVAGGHSGSYAAQVGGTGPTLDDSSISQTLAVPSAGGGLTFWYQVHCPDTVTFDWAVATLQDNATGATTTILNNTCTNTGTWVQASYNLAANAGHSVTLTLTSHDDNFPGDPTYTLYDDVLIAAAPGAPSNLVAKVTSLTTIALSWTASTGSVDHYQVERSQNGLSNFTIVATPTSAPPPATPLNDAGVSGSTAYLYRVCAVDGFGNKSAYASVVLATTVLFHNEPLNQPPGMRTTIAAQHLGELRTAVEAVRRNAGLAPGSYSYGPPVTGSVIHFQDVQDLRTNLNAGLSSLGFTPPAYTDNPLSQGMIVKAIHIQELRNAVNGGHQ